MAISFVAGGSMLSFVTKHIYLFICISLSLSHNPSNFIGFDPYADSVGPGIYGGIVKRDADGQIEIGAQYQNHNKRPGPVYAGGGYTPINTALKNTQRLVLFGR